MALREVALSTPRDRTRAGAYPNTIVNQGPARPENLLAVTSKKASNEANFDSAQNNDTLGFKVEKLVNELKRTKPIRSAEEEG